MSGVPCRPGDREVDIETEGQEVRYSQKDRDESSREKVTILFEGEVSLNEQDPYEPTGVLLGGSDLASQLKEEFGLIPGSDEDTRIGKNLRITIEEI